jgi:hypothetical protein
MKPIETLIEDEIRYEQEQRNTDLIRYAGDIGNIREQMHTKTIHALVRALYAKNSTIRFQILEEEVPAIKQTAEDAISRVSDDPQQYINY